MEMTKEEDRERLAAHLGKQILDAADQLHKFMPELQARIEVNYHGLEFDVLVTPRDWYTV